MSSTISSNSLRPVIGRDGKIVLKGNLLLFQAAEKPDTYCYIDYNVVKTSFPQLHQVLPPLPRSTQTAPLLPVGQRPLQNLGARVIQAKTQVESSSTTAKFDAKKAYQSPLYFDAAGAKLVSVKPLPQNSTIGAASSAATHPPVAQQASLSTPALPQPPQPPRAPQPAAQPHQAPNPHQQRQAAIPARAEPAAQLHDDNEEDADEPEEVDADGNVVNDNALPGERRADCFWQKKIDVRLEGRQDDPLLTPTDLLIGLYKKHIAKFRDQKTRKKNVWQIVANEMAGHNLRVPVSETNATTGAACAAKFRAIKNCYMKHKNPPTGTAAKAAPFYYDRIDAILSGSQLTVPQFVGDTLPEPSTSSSSSENSPPTPNTSNVNGISQSRNMHNVKRKLKPESEHAEFKKRMLSAQDQLIDLSRERLKALKEMKDETNANLRNLIAAISNRNNAS